MAAALAAAGGAGGGSGGARRGAQLPAPSSSRPICQSPWAAAAAASSSRAARAAVRLVVGRAIVWLLRLGWPWLGGWG